MEVVGLRGFTVYGHDGLIRRINYLQPHTSKEKYHRACEHLAVVTVFLKLSSQRFTVALLYSARTDPERWNS